MCVYIFVDILVRDTFEYAYACVHAAHESYVKDPSILTHVCVCIHI